MPSLTKSFAFGMWAYASFSKVLTLGLPPRGNVHVCSLDKFLCRAAVGSRLKFGFRPPWKAVVGTGPAGENGSVLQSRENPREKLLRSVKKGGKSKPLGLESGKSNSL